MLIKTRLKENQIAQKLVHLIQYVKKKVKTVPHKERVEITQKEQHNKEALAHVLKEATKNIHIFLVG